MREGSWTGIEGVVTEDYAMIISMGTIYDRSRENLFPADQLCIKMRRKLLRAARDLQGGSEPFMLQPEETRRLHGGHHSALLVDTSKWHEMMPGNLAFRVQENSAAKKKTRPAPPL